MTTLSFKEEYIKITPDGLKWKRDYTYAKRSHWVFFKAFWKEQKPKGDLAKTKVTISKLSNGSLDFYKEISKGHKLGEAIGHLVEVEKLKRGI
jgi:hypothetical protein